MTMFVDALHFFYRRRSRLAADAGEPFMTQSSNSSSWTSTQAYVLALICLVVGVAVGYFVRGSASPAAPTAAVEQASSAQAPAGMGAMDPSKVTPEQLKHMVEKQVEPIQQ